MCGLSYVLRRGSKLNFITSGACNTLLINILIIISYIFTVYSNYCENR